jgi:hypothetical protein
MKRLYDYILHKLDISCRHERYTWPRKGIRTIDCGFRKYEMEITYVCCLDCGKQLDYDINEMRITQ